MQKGKILAAAFRRASALLSNKRRLFILLSQFGQKALTIKNPRENGRQLLEDWLVLGRLLKAYARGQYRNVSAKSLMAMLAGIVYFVNPIDAIPDAIPFTGFIDDFSVMMWLYQSVAHEIQKFSAWEQRIPQ